MTDLILILLLVFYGCARLQRRFEAVLPVVTLALMLALTGLSMAGALAGTDILLATVCVLAGAYAIFERVTGRFRFGTLLKNAGRYGFTPALVGFAALCVFYSAAAQPMAVWWRDDLAHWGLEVKSLWHFNGLVDGARMLNVRFGDYPPGLQVLQWLMMRVGGEWSEATLYSTLFITYAVFLLPLFSGLSWKKAYLLPLMFVFCVAFPTFGNVLSYVFLGIDTSLSLCFGYVLVMIWRHRRGDLFSLLAIALGLCGLILIKQIGVLLAGMAVALYALRKTDRGLKTVAALLLPAATLAVWYLYCKAMGLSGYNSSGAFQAVANLFSGTYQPPENAAGVLPALLHALLTRYSGDITLSTAAPWPLPLLFWLIVLPAVPLLLSAAKAQPFQEMRLASLWMLGTGALMIVAIYLSFFTTFYYETNVYTYAQQDNMVLLIERYLAPLLLGHGMLALWLTVEAFEQKRLRIARPLPCIAVCTATALVALSTNWALMATVLNPNVYYQNERSIGSEATVRDQEYWGAALDNIPNARVMIDLDSTSDYVKELVYSFAPARFFLSTDINTESTDALVAYLQAESITQLICLQDGSPLQAAAAPLTADGELYSYTLYNVHLADGQVTLEENTD